MLPWVYLGDWELHHIYFNTYFLNSRTSLQLQLIWFKVFISDGSISNNKALWQIFSKFLGILPLISNGYYLASSKCLWGIIMFRCTYTLYKRYCYYNILNGQWLMMARWWWLRKVRCILVFIETYKLNIRYDFPNDGLGSVK